MSNNENIFLFRNRSFNLKDDSFQHTWKIQLLLEFQVTLTKMIFIKCTNIKLKHDWNLDQDDIFSSHLYNIEILIEKNNNNYNNFRSATFGQNFFFWFVLRRRLLRYTLILVWNETKIDFFKNSLELDLSEKLRSILRYIIYSALINSNKNWPSLKQYVVQQSQLFCYLFFD